MIGAATLAGVLFPQELKVTSTHFIVTWLPELTPPEQPVLKPPPEMAKVSVPKLKPLEAPALPDPPPPLVADLVVPKLRPAISPTPVRVPEPPLPAPPIAPQSPAPKVQIPVRTGLFGGAAEPVTTKRPVQEVQTGGFGSPEGVPGRAQRNPGNVPMVGSFGLPEGPGVGNGTGGPRGVQGVVASAGFGSGIAGAGSGRGSEGSKVTMGGFEKVAMVAQSPTKSLPAAPPSVDFQPIEILSKPTPVYTDEARRMGIQGEVALSVVFEANGAIRIIGVVKFLGHGLDEAAQQAAAQIRFKPAQRDGKPTDFPATLRIQFRLADQST